MKQNIKLPDLEKDTHDRALFIHTDWEDAFKNGNPFLTKGASLLNHI